MSVEWKRIIAIVVIFAGCSFLLYCHLKLQVFQDDPQVEGQPGITEGFNQKWGTNIPYLKSSGAVHSSVNCPEPKP